MWQRHPCSALKTANETIFEARPGSGVRFSWCRVNESTPRRGSIGRGLPSASAGCHRRPNHDADSEPSSTHGLPLDRLEERGSARSVRFPVVPCHAYSEKCAAQWALVGHRLGFRPSVFSKRFWRYMTEGADDQASKVAFAPTPSAVTPKPAIGAAIGLPYL